MNLFLSKDNPWSHWSVERLLTELLDLRRSGWDGIGYMMAGKDQPERLFFVAGEIGDFPSGRHDVTSTGGLHGAFSQGGTL